MRVNLSPVKTCVNYGINDFLVDDDKINLEDIKFKNFRLENAKNCKMQAKKPQKPAFVLANELSLQSVSTNCSLNIDVERSAPSPISLWFDFDSQNKALYENVTFNVLSGVKAKLVIKYSANVPAYHNGFLKFCLQQGSALDVVVVSDFEQSSTNILNVESQEETDAHLSLFNIDFGSFYSVLSQHASLVGDESVCDSKCLYLGGGQNQFDLNLVSNVYGYKCKTNIDSIGALLGEAKKNFKGTINFVKGCKKSSGSESELCMLLSKGAKSKALPMLLCTEEDVDGSHSSAVGKIDDKELFYVMTRGLSKQEALKLVIKAKFNSILGKIFDKNLQNEIIKKIDGKLENEEYV